MNKKNELKSGNYSTSFNEVVFNEIDKNSSCLDIGCWTGNLGKKLIDLKQCTVDGIDFKTEVLREAQKNGYRQTYKVNLNDSTYNLEIIERKYDAIIFADVLEHLINPELLLEEIKPLLKPEGVIIVSLPNVAFLLNRINLLCGKWNYTEFGTLDKTHLKFYTIDSGAQLVRKAGYEILKLHPYNQFGILTKIHPLDTWFPKLLSYQFLIKARHND